MRGVNNTASFIQRAMAVHGDIYSYVNSDWSSQYNPVTIICGVHGEFQQQPKLHLRGHGCKRCGDEYRGKLNSSNIKRFISAAAITHNDFYDYSSVNYVHSKELVEIICPLHGRFMQSPHNHLKGHGCGVCSGSKVFDTDSFITAANKVHNAKYDYSRVVYHLSHTKVIISCSRHGIFHQKPNTHLNGHGCPTCRESKGEHIIRMALTASGVNFAVQYRINECRNKLPLPFDFALLDDDNTLIGLIEFQGAQHFIESSFGSNKLHTSRLLEISGRDAIKKEYCDRNHIPLLIIPYWNKNIIYELLQEFLNNIHKSN